MTLPRHVISALAALICVPLLASAEDAPFKVTFNLTNLVDSGDGVVTVLVHPEWAPLGAARFKELVEADFFKNIRFFRVISGFMAQFGISGDPVTASKWRAKNIKDDPVKMQNLRGRLTFATAGPGTRTSQIFVNFRDNTNLDSQGFAPFAEVIDGGMSRIDRLYSGYGEGAPSGRGPDQGQTQSRGNSYLDERFPKLSYISSATMAGGDATAVSDAVVGKNEFVPEVTAGTADRRGTGALLLILGCLALSVCACFAASRIRGKGSVHREGVADGIEAEELKCS